jgi:hypothetical protein
MTKKNKLPPKVCKNCSHYAVRDEKYCIDCKKQILQEMKSAGYLTETHDKSPISERRGRTTLNPDSSRGTTEMGSDGDNW